MLGVRFADEDIRRARRAYYGSISYIDSMVGRILETLRAIGAQDDTAIIFASDHGEMLGERGMWFKKHFFEPSLKVPLLLKAPWISPQRVQELVSLVDLLPTFMGLAQGAGWQSPVEPLEGMDLCTLLEGNSGATDRAVFAEYLAESTPAPLLMIRRGPFKYIWSSVDPVLLFDLENDPHEQVNLATLAEYSDVLARFEVEALQKWDSEAMSREIVRSQRQRRLIMEVQRSGKEVRWNHDESAEDDVLWYRGKGSYNEWAFAYLPLEE